MFESPARIIKLLMRWIWLLFGFFVDVGSIRLAVFLGKFIDGVWRGAMLCY
ncbi:MAG: hypothetical protein ACOY3V_03850 [Pseudomonadota bacterium]